MKLKSFKDYLKDLETVKLPALETVFGRHSQEQEPKKLPALITSFGNHSKKSDKLNEGTIETHVYDNHVHENVAPLDKEKMNPDRNNALKFYTKSSYSLNSALHNHYNEDNLESKKHKLRGHVDDIEQIESLLNEHRTKQDGHVFAGIRFSPAKHFKYDSNGKPHPHVDMHLPAFTSTSSDHEMVERFSERTYHEGDKSHGIEHKMDKEGKPVIQHVLKINMPKGTSASSVRDISNSPRENEVLLNRGHNIRIHSHPTHVGNGIVHWNADIIGHEPSKLT